MGATRIRCIMKTCVILAIVAVAFSADSFSEDFSDEISFIQDEPAETLASAVHELRSAAPELLQAHVDHIAKHAELIQSHSMSSKAKAYAHNFAASQRAIKAALKSLNDQLAAGHSHDKNALNTARANAGTLLANVKSKSKAAVNNYRGKACPSKRAEESANAKKAAAKSKLDKEKNTKICTLATTWGDMDIDKSTPKFGSALRNGWDQARSKWLKAKAAWDAAVKAHNTAIANHNKAMASFTTAVKIEATNTVNQCNNGHKEYNILKNEVASNVRTRKATFIATLVIACYIDNVASNSAAKACADKQRKASVSQWNITPAALAACSSSASLQHTYGPLSWQPTAAACHIHFKPERDAKAAAAKKEKDAKETAAKESAQKKAEKSEKAKAAELKQKEAAAKQKEKNDKAAARKERADKDEKKSKELSSKEKSSKEKSNKAVLRVTRHAWHGWINNWDGNMGWHTGGATFVSGLHSTHDNGREDRLFKPLVTTFGANQRSHHWYGWINNWDHRFDFTCGHNMAIIGFSSYHSNHREDRRWKVLCSTFHGVNVRHDGWPGWQTNWDATWSLSCGHRPMVGMSSYHDNGKEDRRWRIRCGTMQARL